MRPARLLLVLAASALLVPALVLTALALTQPGFGAAVVAVSFTPWAVALYGGALLLLVVLLVRARTRGMAALAAFAALGLALHLAWARDYVVGGGPGEGEAITVGTANVRYGDADPDELLRLALTQEIDVLVVVELDAQLLAALERRGVAQRYPHRVGWASPGAEGTMVFSRFPLGSSRRLAMPLASLHVVVHSDQGAFTLLGVHVRRPGLGGATGWAGDLRTLRREVSVVDGPLVLAGDFNATLEHRPLAEVLDEGDLVDSVQATDSGWSPTWPSNDSWRLLGVPMPAMVQIDHVLTSRGVSVLGSSTYRLHGTDHRAVVTRISLSGTRP